MVEFCCKCGIELLVLDGQKTLDCPCCGREYSLATTYTIFEKNGDGIPLKIRERFGEEQDTVTEGFTHGFLA